MAVLLIQPNIGGTPSSTFFHKGNVTDIPVAPPFTLFVKFNASALPGALGSALVNIERMPPGFGGYHHFILGLSASSGMKVFARSTGPAGLYSSSSEALSTGSYALDTWHSAAAVFPAHTSRKVYLDATSTTDSTQVNPPSGLEDVLISSGATVTVNTYNKGFHGCLQDVCIWDIALSDANITSLHGGTDPKTIAPENLVFYVPLVSEATQLQAFAWDGAAVTAIPDVVLNVEPADNGDTIDCTSGAPEAPEVPALVGLYTAPVLIGLNYCSQGQLLRPDHGPDAGAANGPAFGKLRRVHNYTASLYRTRSISFGIDFDKLRLQPLRTPGGTAMAAPSLYTGIIDGGIESKYDFENQIAWEICRPYPATILAIGGYGATSDK